jgi:hypothetical protein
LPKKEDDYKRKFRPLAATYVTFSPDGRELLANLGGEQGRPTLLNFWGITLVSRFFVE